MHALFNDFWLIHQGGGGGGGGGVNVHISPMRKRDMDILTRKFEYLMVKTSDSVSSKLQLRYKS